MATRIKKLKFFALGFLLTIGGAALAATFNLFQPATGLLKGNANTYVTTAAASSDVIGLWTGPCTSSASRFLATNGTCQTVSGTGTVTSVGLAGTGIFGASGSPVTSSGTLTVTTTGTSGGIPYFSNSSTVSSSAALTAGQVVIGGGAGTAPSVLAAGTEGQVLSMISGTPTWTSGLGIPDLPASAGLSASDLFIVYDVGDIQSQQATLTQVQTGVLGTLTANALVVGGGAGTAPTTTTTINNGTVVIRINPRVQTAADATSITPTGDTADMTFQANTQSGGTLTVNAPTGTPVNGQKWTLRVKSTNAQTFSWNGVFRGSDDAALPTTTSGSSKTDYYGFIFNSADTKWDFVSTVAGF